MAYQQNIFIKIFVSHKGRSIQIPVNPQEITITRNTMDRETQVLDLGEIIQHKGMGLTSISFSSFIPFYGNAHYVNERGAAYPGMLHYLDFFRELYQYKDLIDRLIFRDDGVCRLVIADGNNPGQSISMKCVVTQFDESIQGSDPDRHYEITFTEWKNYGGRILTIANVVDGVAHLRVTSGGASIL